MRFPSLYVEVVARLTEVLDQMALGAGLGSLRVSDHRVHNDLAAVCSKRSSIPGFLCELLCM